MLYISVAVVCISCNLIILYHSVCVSVADLEGAEPAPPPSPLGRQTDAVTVLPISENGSVLWLRHCQLTYQQVTAMHQSYEVTRLK